MSTPSPETTTTYPVPDGCPAADDLGVTTFGEYYDADNKFVAIDAGLLDGEVTTDLPAGGCAYLIGGSKKSNNSDDTYRRVEVWYFNLGAPGKVSAAQMADFVSAVGGTPRSATPVDGPSHAPEPVAGGYDLPDTFSGWTGGIVDGVDGDSSWLPQGRDSKIPAFSQGSQAKIEFSIASAKADAILAASGVQGTPGSSSTPSVPSDPLGAMKQGLTLHVSGTVSMTDDQGYAATADVDVRLQPFASDVTDAAPGKTNAVSSSVVTAKVTNTTAQRRTVAPGIRVVVVYPPGSTACVGGVEILVKTARSGDPKNCGIVLDNLDSVTLDPGGSQEVGGVKRALKLGPVSESSDALTQLNLPTSVYVFLNSPNSGTRWTGNRGCEGEYYGEWDGWFVPLDGMHDALCQ